MTQNPFDIRIDRRNTNSLKYDFALEHGRPADVLPLWVADMDFRAPAPVLKALHRAVDHGIFGYSDVKSDYYDAVAEWFRTRLGWETRPEWLVKTPGVVFALATVVRALTRPGEAVLVQSPVYYPFYNVVRENGRTLVENRLIYRNHQYTMDFAGLEREIVRHKVKLMLLCSPHNPVGRVWTRAELQEVGRICKAHGVFVVSDEIHCDFTFPEHPHTVFPAANPDLAGQCLVCTAPSKTFNLAGLQVSNIWIPGEAARARFQAELGRSGYGPLNTLGLVACQAAYREGGPWLEQCKAYLRENLAFLRTFLAQRLPEIKLVEPEGTYFAWLDCTGLGMDRRALNDCIIHRARLWLDAGHIFGAEAELFQRIVLACPRATLEQALVQLERAVRGE